jgi:hypothetical protein
MKRAVVGVLGALILCGSAPRVQPEPGVTNRGKIGAAITLGPYVQPLSVESVAIQWRTDQPSYSWVEYGATEAMGTKGDASVNGLRVADVREHRVVLAGLRTGTNYWYRVCVKPIRSMTVSNVDFAPEEDSAITALHTLPGPEQPFTAVIFNDLHNRAPVFQQLLKVVANTSFDFSLFNGDCVANPQSEDTVLSVVAMLIRGVQAGQYPTIFVRGNHETFGAYARDLPRCFSWPDDKPYFALSIGAARFVVLDVGGDRLDDNPARFGLTDFASFRREETQWLRNEIASDVFRRATWRILVHHIPFYLVKSGEPGREAWGKILADAHIDLAINAHTHNAIFHPANTIGAPYPIAIGGGPTLKLATVMLLQGDCHRLKLRTLNSAGRQMYPDFEITR